MTHSTVNKEKEFLDRYEDLKYSLRQREKRGDGGDSVSEWLRKEIWLFDNYGRFTR